MGQLFTINDGRVAIVTGAGQGIGKGIAKNFAKAGAYVAVVDWNKENAELVTQEILNEGGTAIAISADVGNPADVQRIVDTVMEKWGTVDILVNNAGINRDAIMYKMTEDQFDAVLRVDLKGPFLLMKAVYWTMRNKKFGRIVNISSPASKGNLGQANYSSAKAGLIALTNTAALEFAKHGITVNAICPGLIDTPMARSMPESDWNRCVEAIPSKRVGTGDDMAYMAMFFASEEASYINGQLVYVDGAQQTGLKK